MKQLRESGAAQRAPQADETSARELSGQQRLIVQNLFDSGSQLKRREAYLKKLGFQMNPKDPNQYRPVDGGEYLEIDPGFGSYKSMLSEGEYLKAAKEAFADSGDVIFDTLSGAANLGARIAGGVGGAAASAPTAGLGSPAMIAFGAMAAGAAGNAAAEGIKTAVGDLFLSDKVPVDKESLVLESAIAGVMPEAIRAAGKTAGATAVKNAARSAIARLSAAKNAVESLGTLDKTLMDDVIKNPWNYTKAKLENANQYLQKSYKDLFGIAEDSVEMPKDVKFIRPDSVFGKIMGPLKEAQEKELALLDKNPAASFKISDVADFYRQAIGQLEQIPIDQRSREQTSAIRYLNTKLRQTADQAKKMDPSVKYIDDVLSRPNLTKKFSDMKQTLESVQSDIFDSEVPGSTVLKQIFGGSDTGLRTILDNKAKAAGSALPDINAQISKGLDIYKDASKNLKGDTLRSMVQGGNSDKKTLVNNSIAQINELAKGNKGLVQNLNTQRGFKLKDEIPTDDFLNKFSSEALSANAQNIIQSDTTRGSSNALAAALKSGAKGAAIASGAGFSTGTALSMGNMNIGAKTALAAGLYGGVKGAFEGAVAANPKLAIQSLSSRAQKASQTLGQDRFSQLVSSGVDPLSGQALGEGAVERGLKKLPRLGKDIATSAIEQAPEMFRSPTQDLAQRAAATIATQPMLDAGVDESRTIFSGDTSAQAAAPESFAERFKRLREQKKD